MTLQCVNAAAGPDARQLGSVYGSLMDEVVGALREQLDELRTIVTDLNEDQLGLPSGCEGWSIADVLLHLAQTNEMAAASARGALDAAVDIFATAAPSTIQARTDIDDLAGAAVERERGPSGIAVRERWIRSAEGMADALAACDPALRVEWVAGDMAPRSLATTRIAETWLHTGDICAGLGVEQPKTERIWHVARLVQRTVPYALLRAGLAATGEVRFEVTSPVDESVVWPFGPDGAATVITGPAIEVCLVAGQRVDVENTTLSGTGPDADNVLRTMRTFA